MNYRKRWTDREGGALAKLFIFLFILAAVVTAAWIFFLPILLTGTLEKRTGFNVKVTRLVVNPFKARIEVDGLLVTNPSTSFARPEFVNVRSFYADAELKTLWSDRLVIDLAQIDVEQITLVRNSQGLLNVTLFQDRIIAPPPEEKPPEPPKQIGAINGKPIMEKQVAPVPTPPPAPAVVQKPINFLIKRLEVRLDKLVATDYTTDRPTSREFKLGFSHTYENVTDPKQLLEPVTMKSMTAVGTAIRSLIPGDVGKTIGEVTNQSTKLFQEAGRKSADALKTIVDTLEQSKNP